MISDREQEKSCLLANKIFPSFFLSKIHQAKPTQRELEILVTDVETKVLYPKSASM